LTTIEALALAAGDAVNLEVFERQLAESGMRSQGVEPMPPLVADRLGDAPTLARFGRNRPHRLTGCRDRQSRAA